MYLLLQLYEKNGNTFLLSGSSDKCIYLHHMIVSDSCGMHVYYSICSNISLGFYFLPGSGDPGPASIKYLPVPTTRSLENGRTNLTTSSFLGRFSHPCSSETLKKLTDSYIQCTSTRFYLVDDRPHP